MTAEFQPNSDIQLPELVHVGDPIIRSVCQSAGDMRQAASCCKLLTEKLRQIKGAGLAAPQIGLPWRVFVVEVKKTEMFPDREESPLYEVINPDLRIISNEVETDWEGCFSIPGLVGQVPRARDVELRYWNPQGEEVVQTFHGYLARVMQHEFDHLNGCVYVDRMPDMKTLWTRDNYMELLRRQRAPQG